MNILRNLDSSGDSPIEFDDSQAMAEARAKAKALFERVTQKEGGAAFNINPIPGEPDKKITSFEQAQGDTVLCPRIVGG